MKDEKLNELSRKVFSLTLKSTTMVVKPSPPVITPLGNGVLLEINGEYYILSAGHLFNVKDFPSLMIPAKDNLVSHCNGRLLTTYETYNDKNKIDLAVFKFSDRQNKHIEGYYQFIKPNEIILEHQIVETSSYIISGYPINSIKKTTSQPEYQAEPLQILTGTIKSSKYRKFGYDTSTHILVKLYGRVKPFFANNKIRLKSPTGISGSGLRYVPNWNILNENGVPKHFLVGILAARQVSSTIKTSGLVRVFNPIRTMFCVSDARKLLYFV